MFATRHFPCLVDIPCPCFSKALPCVEMAPFLVPTGVLSSGVFHCSSDVCLKMSQAGEIDGLSYWDIGERNMLEFYRNPVRYVPKIFKLFIENPLKPFVIILCFCLDKCRIGGHSDNRLIDFLSKRRLPKFRSFSLCWKRK
jgi:hypothetical protein